jgi:DNA recombination protein RmuC
MEFFDLVLGLSIGLFLGIIIGWLVSRSKSPQTLDLSQQTGQLSSLSNQIVELKTKFEEIEKTRIELEKSRSKYEELREEKLKQWIEQSSKLFSEQSESGKKIDAEKDKRLIEWMEKTQKFFDEQKGSYTKFLEDQGKSREDIERKRDAQIADMQVVMQSFTRTVAGTKTRGMIGEEQLKEVLNNSIKAGSVVCDLKTDTGNVEFAWNLEDGKYIPIDCKLPDVFVLLDNYSISTDVEEQKQIKKQIIDKIRLEIKRIQKYQNLMNTIESSILVVPEGVLEMAPQLVGEGRSDNVFICSYKDVFPVAYWLSEKYVHLKKQGNIGKYRQIISDLMRIFYEINKNTDTIQRGLGMIDKANNQIKKNISKANNKVEDDDSLVPEDIEKITE